MTPAHIENHATSGTLTVRWDDGSIQQLTHAALRSGCPCSGCRAARRAGETVDAPSGVRVATIAPAGHNALNVTFTDGHTRGIYPFALLAQLSLCHMVPGASDTN